MADLTNTSIFAGWLQFTANGREYRAEKRGWAVHVYARHDGAFIHDAVVTSKFTPKAVWAAYAS